MSLVYGTWNRLITWAQWICILAMIWVIIQSIRFIYRQYSQSKSLTVSDWMKFMRLGASPTPPPSTDPTVSTGESWCKIAAERITGKPFNKVRLSELMNPITGFPLELDCYNPELKVAIEYNGQQHYQMTPYYHQSNADFHNQQYRDYIKSELCTKNGIKLIVVPYTMRNEESIQNYLIGQL